jgi:molecular chaperone DnaK (HSP70)
MIKEAKAHAEEDRRFHELVQARNQADALIHATRKFMGELGSKRNPARRTQSSRPSRHWKMILVGVRDFLAPA